MSKAIPILGGLLVVQLGLAAFTWAGGARLGGASDTKPLVGGDLGDVTELEIIGKATDDKPAKTVKLVKNGDAWVVATAADFPAKTEKVEEILKKLVEAKVREPIATNKANHGALKVSEKTFDKKVRVKVGGDDVNLVVGAGKSSSIHARRAERDEVYLARGVSAWAISDRVTSYIETEYVKVEDPTEVSVQNPAGTINLVKDDEGNWKVTELPPDADVDDSRVSSFVSAARSIRMTDPVGKAVKPEYGLDNATVVVLKNKDRTVSYSIGALDGDDHYVKADGQDFVVKVSKWSVERLRDQTPQKFIKEPEKPGGPPGGAPGMPPGMQLPPGMQMPPGMPPMPPPR